MSATLTTTDEARLLELNAGYIRAFLNEDAAWYDAHLADDFICIRTDGAFRSYERASTSCPTW